MDLIVKALDNTPFYFKKVGDAGCIDYLDLPFFKRGDQGSMIFQNFKSALGTRQADQGHLS